MAEDTANGVVWLLQIKQEDAEWLGGIRHWQHLRIASDEGSLWVKGFRDEEVSAPIVRSIPGKKIWYEKEHLLFPQGGMVPSRKAPSLLWSPIERGLPLQLPAWNHNYFGFDGAVAVSLVASSVERESCAMRTSLEQLGAFIQTASSIRSSQLSWTILEGEDALVLGTPLLPIPGQALWADGDFLIPAGYDFEWPELTAHVKDLLKASSEPVLILWHADGTYSSISKGSFRPLSLGSFRQSASLLQHSKSIQHEAGR